MSTFSGLLRIFIGIACILPVLVFEQNAFGQEQAVANLGAIALQEQSIARQMDAITSSGAQLQAESIRTQAESLRQQHGRGSDGLPAPKPVSPERSSAAPSADIQPTAPGFYTVPWPSSPDFVMPNIQVATTACDALGTSDINSLIKDASAKNNIDSALLRAVMKQESGFRPCAVSTAGAMGLMQIMPDTADDLGLSDPFDPSANVNAGAKYLKQMLERYHGNTALALAAYNAGPGRTDKADGGIPEIPETIGYVASILSNIPLF